MNRYLIFDFGHAGYGDCYQMCASIDLIAEYAHRIPGHVVIKFQYFTDREITHTGPPLSLDDLLILMRHSNNAGLLASTSVFGNASLNDVLAYSIFKDMPFLKIAGDPAYYRLIGKVPRSFPLLVSVADEMWARRLIEAFPDISLMWTIKDYPAAVMDYKERFAAERLSMGISDHTATTGMYFMHSPQFYEKHVVHSEEAASTRPYALYGTSLIRFLEEVTL